MEVNKNKLKIMGVISILVLGFLFITGYRLTGIQAAKAHFEIGRDAQLLGYERYDWGNIYIFNTSKGYRTAISQRLGFLWRAKNAFYTYENSDLIKTIGGGSNEKATLYALEVTDEKVAYIEIGTGIDRIRKNVSDASPIIFSWNKSISWNDFNGIAYSKDGEQIYEYRYPKDTNYLNHQDLRWYPIR